jgi:hypothetical protein
LIISGLFSLRLLSLDLSAVWAYHVLPFRRFLFRRFGVPCFAVWAFLVPPFWRFLLLIDKETMGREIRWKKPKLPVNDREKWRNRAVCERKEMQLNKKSAESGCQSLSALFCC